MLYGKYYSWKSRLHRKVDPQYMLSKAVFTDEKKRAWTPTYNFLVFTNAWIVEGSHFFRAYHSSLINMWSYRVKKVQYDCSSCDSGLKIMRDGISFFQFRDQLFNEICIFTNNTYGILYTGMLKGFIFTSKYLLQG